MATQALRQLGVGSLKRIYKLDVPELCSTLQDAAKRRVDDKQIWEALLYRAALLRSELRPLHLALTVDALGKVRRSDRDFMNFLMEEVRSKSRRFLPRDVALLLNGFAKLSVRDEMLTASLVPPLLRRLSEKTRPDDLALLALSLARLNDPARAPIFDQVVAATIPRMHKIQDGHSLSLLACAFTRPLGAPSDRMLEGGHSLPLFRDEQEANEAPNMQVGGSSSSSSRPQSDFLAEHEDSALPHLAFVEELLLQCDKQLWNFRAGDVLHLCLALSTLAQRGHEDLLPPRILKRIERRLDSLYFELLPVQIVRLLEVLEHLPDLEKACSSKLLDEVAYRMREVTPLSAIAILKVVRRLGGHHKAHSAVAWRLTRTDAGATLTIEDCCEVAELFASLKPRLWEAREAMLCLLDGVSGRRLQPEVALLVRLLEAYAEMGVRDTHWFHLSGKLSVCDVRDETSMVPRRGVPALPPLDEEVAASALMSLAKLNLPMLIDASYLVKRAIRASSSSASASTVLEAVSLLSLIGRKPSELHRPSVLQPLVDLLVGEEDLAKCHEWQEERLPPTLRLFPFSELASSAAPPEVGTAWRRLAAERAKMQRSEQERHPLFLAITSEISSWEGVQIETAIPVGPLVAPWALDLVSLAEHLSEYPFEEDSEPQQVFPTFGDDVDDDDIPEEDSDDEEHLPRGRQRSSSDKTSKTAATTTPSAAEAEEQGNRRGEGEGEDEDEKDGLLLSSGGAGTTSRRRRGGGGGGGGTAAARSRRRATKKADVELDDEAALLASGKKVSKSTHVLLLPLYREDFYHASATLRGQRQRAKLRVLSASKYAEIALMKRLGWHVVCVAEDNWQWTPDSVDGSSVHNKALILQGFSQLGAA